MAKEKKEKPEEKRPEKEPEVPVVDFGLGLGGIFKDLGELINGVTKLAKEAEELKKSGVLVERRAMPQGMYGIRVKVGPQGPVLSKFGTIKPTIEPGVPEVREPLADVFESDGEVTVIAELPGVEEKDIKLRATERTLKISAETKDRKYSKDVELPAEVTGEPKSSYRNGVLEVKLKKAK